jgi:parallel beta-helix repeat protein
MSWGKRFISLLLVLTLMTTILPFNQLQLIIGDKSIPLALSLHSPIHINGDGQFTLANGVVAGDGSIGNPYLIENWTINTTISYGIWIENTNAYFIIKNCQIYNGTIGNSTNKGIYLNNVKNGTIINCNISNNYYGFYLSNSNDNLIYNNTIYNNFCGIYFSNSNNNYIQNNILQNNTNFGINFRTKCSNNYISNNTFNSNIIGIIINDYSSNNVVSYNSFNNNNVISIKISYDSNNNLINNNIILNDFKTSYGILVFEFSNNNKITNNICSNTTVGIDISGWYSKWNIIRNNSCFDNENGIFLRFGANFNSVNNNLIVNNDNGIIIRDRSNSNIIKNNTIINNRLSGINITKDKKDEISQNNLIYNNYFNNTINFVDDKIGINYWNISKTLGKNIIGGPYLGGNFWSDYMGRDTDDDGLGETDLPYGPGDFLPLTDIFPPSIDDNTSGIPTTGDEFIFEADAWDDNIIRNVHVEYWYEYGSNKNLTMNLTNGDLKNGTFTQIINVLSNATKIYYNFSVADTGWNWVSIPIKSMNVFDNDKPLIEDQSSTTPTTGDNFTFAFSISDNIQIFKVSLEYWFDDGIHETKTLTLNNKLFSYITSAPSDAKKLNYIISAEDSSKNWASLGHKIIDVVDNDRPEINDLSGIPTTGDEYKFKFQVSDNIDYSVVNLEYWFDDRNHIYITLPTNLSYTTNIPLETLNLHALVTAIDMSGNSNQLEINKPILDNDAPIIEDLTTGNPETGNNFKIKCLVSENHFIQNVTLESWFDKNDHDLSQMNLDSEIWSLELETPENAEILYYTIISRDLTENSVKIENSLTVLDVIPPELFDLTEGLPTTGDYFEIEAQAEDNINVDYINLEYWFDNRKHTIKVLENTYLINVPSNAKKLFYILKAYDTSENIQTINNELKVIDNDAPLLNDNSSVPTTGDHFEFEVELIDNIGVSYSYLEYWFDENEHVNLSFNGVYSMIVPDNAKVLYYQILAVDGNDNYAYIQKDQIVIDNDKPIIIDLSSKNATTGDIFNVTAFVEDNILLSNVIIEYWLNTEHFLFDMELDDDSYIFSVQIPNNATEFSYLITAYDFSNNNQSLVRTMDVKDNDRPKIEDCSTKSEDSFIFIAEVQDNIGISEVEVEYRFDNGTLTIMNLLLMEDMYENSISIPVNKDRIYYKISAVDNSGNMNITNEKEINTSKAEISKPSVTSEDKNSWLMLALIVSTIIIIIVLVLYLLQIKRKKQKTSD